MGGEGEDEKGLEYGKDEKEEDRRNRKNMKNEKDEMANEEENRRRKRGRNRPGKIWDISEERGGIMKKQLESRNSKEKEEHANNEEELKVLRTKEERQGKG